jgi:hypothetical protein
LATCCPETCRIRKQKEIPVINKNCDFIGSEFKRGVPDQPGILLPKLSIKIKPDQVKSESQS